MSEEHFFNYLVFIDKVRWKEYRSLKTFSANFMDLLLSLIMCQIGLVSQNSPGSVIMLRVRLISSPNFCCN